MDRRRALGLLGAAAFAPVAVRAAPPHYPLGDAFLLLQSYLELPPAARTLFAPAYLVMRDAKPAPDARATMVGAGGARTALTIDPQGEVTNLPTLADLKSKAQFELDGPVFEFVLEMRAVMAPAARIEVEPLAAALAQLNAAIVKFTEGATDEVKQTAAFFPDGGQGQAIFADGHQAALPVFKFKTLGPTAYVEPSRAPGATAVQLAQAPSRIILAGHPG